MGYTVEGLPFWGWEMRCLSASQLIDKFGIDYFKNGSTFGALSEEAIRHLLEKGQILQLNNGEQLFSYDDPGNRFYIVLEGTIQYLEPRQNTFTHIHNYTFGHELGCVAMIGLHDRIGSACAAENSIVLEVSCGLFHELHEALPTDFGILLLNLSREMARRLRDVDTKLAQYNIHL